MVGRDRCAAEGGRLADLRQPDEGEVAMEGQSARVARDGRDRLSASRGQVDTLEQAHAGVEDEQASLVPARRVRHRQSRGHRLTGGHVEHGAAVVADHAPPTRFVGGSHHGDEGRGSVAHRQAVQVTAVLRGQPGDERRPPARHEAVAGGEAGQAGEEGVDDPQVRLAAVSGSPRRSRGTGSRRRRSRSVAASTCRSGRRARSSAASSEWSSSDQICPLPATATRSAPTATPMTRSNPRKERASSPSATPTATSWPAW